MLPRWGLGAACGAAGLCCGLLLRGTPALCGSCPPPAKCPQCSVAEAEPCPEPPPCKCGAGGGGAGGAGGLGGLRAIGLLPQLLAEADAEAARLSAAQPAAMRSPATANRHHRKRDSPLWVLWHRLLHVLLRARKLPVPGWSLGRRGSNSTHPIRVLLPKAIDRAAGALLPPGRRGLRCAEWGDFYQRRIPQCTGGGHVISYKKGGCGPSPVFGNVFCMDLNKGSRHVPDGHFDVIVATQVLEHIRRPFRAAVTLSRILAPGGVLMLSAPFVGDPFHDRPWDYFRYTERGLAAVFRGSGLCAAAGPWKLGGLAAALGGLLGLHSTDLLDDDLGLDAPAAADVWYATFVALRKQPGGGGRGCPPYGADIDAHSPDNPGADDAGSEAGSGS
eukprot:TRINITY_DN41698_c0_g1_i1.p1 TRINITY_DN41698_c0_g1~~TRINITY_DN41698_c0_g1_i1.p1  ORF type:complete len:407 (+),score=104.66 TRINITY_DN41698_c0_g1_i1:56-1222(+)